MAGQCHLKCLCYKSRFCPPVGGRLRARALDHWILEDWALRVRQVLGANTNISWLYSSWGQKKKCTIYLMKFDASRMRLFRHADIKLPEVWYAGPERAWEVTERMKVTVVDHVSNNGANNDGNSETCKIWRILPSKGKKPVDRNHLGNHELLKQNWTFQWQDIEIKSILRSSSAD